MKKCFLFLSLLGIGGLILVGCGKSEPPVDENDPVAFGKQVFTANCALCHQLTGLGLPNQYPPLAGSDIVLSQNGFGQNHLARILLNGLVEPINVQGNLYNGVMAEWRDVLTDAQIAAVLTYIRQAWGNHASPITKEQIAAARAEVARRSDPWTIEELKKIPAAPLVEKPPKP